MDGWNTSLLLGWPIFRGYVSFRECISATMKTQNVESHHGMGTLDDHSAGRGIKKKGTT